MFFENITYLDQLPFGLSFLNVGEESKHCHRELEILLVLRGMTHYQIYHMDYELAPGDLIIADVEDLHQIHDSSQDILILSIHVDTKQFEELYPNIRYMFFVCEECMEGPSSNKQLLQTKLALLKQCMAKLAFECTQRERNFSKLMGGINELVSILVQHFQGFFMEDFQYKTTQENISQVDLARLSGITRYIMQNYNRKITLEDVSKMEHLNLYYVSHLIKKTLGFNFQNFVNGIRLEFAEKLLVFSNLTLMQISEECGFSSPNYFNKCFSAWHGKTPAQYRKDYHPCKRRYQNPICQEEALVLLKSYFNPSQDGEGEASDPIVVHMEIGEAPFTDFWQHYGLEILLKSLKDVIKLGFMQEEVKRLRPKAFLLEESLLKGNKDLEPCINHTLDRFSLPLRMVRSSMEPKPEEGITSGAKAFYRMFQEGYSRASLFGDGDGLFTPQGIGTPLYAAYQYFTTLEVPRVFVGQQQVYVKHEGGIGVILYNKSLHSARNVKVLLASLRGEYYLVRTELSPKDSSYSALWQLKNPNNLSPLMKQRIEQVNSGRVSYSAIDGRKEKELNFLLYPDTAVILEFFSVARLEN